MTARTLVAAFTLVAALSSGTTLALTAEASAPIAAAKGDASPSRAVYEQYGCVACHGDTGNGSCDLRDANRTFPTDAELRAFIDDPATTHPGSKMPAYGDVIDEADYAPLLAHVRKLSRAAR